MLGFSIWLVRGSTAALSWGVRTQFRDSLTPQSDITATSELGPQFNGTVEINTPDVNPSSGLLELQGNFTDVSDRIASACPASGGNSFTVTGRGGLHPDPAQTLFGRAIWRDLRSVDRSRNISLYSIPNSQPPIIEATAWEIDRNGELKLVANSHNNNISPSTWNEETKCNI